MTLENGSYTIDVTLSGGSGRASVESPASLEVVDGTMRAEIKWSSPHYDYMKIGEKEYYPVNTTGHSTFLIDVEALDADIPVTAETVAMSRPHMIDYTLRFDSSTARPAGGTPVSVILILSLGAAALLAGAGLLLRRRKSE